MAVPWIKIAITGSNGTSAETKVMEPITITVPAELSLRIAALYLMEVVMKQLRKQGFREALKAIGLK